MKLMELSQFKPNLHTMNRKEFVQSHGATCQNWTWSWSFINEAERIIIFGAWDRHTAGDRSLILTDEWQVSDRGRRQAGYAQSREHVRLVEEDGYRLMTFPLRYSDAKKGDGGLGPAVIDGFDPILTERGIVRVGGCWYAADPLGNGLPEELPEPVRYPEGATVALTINAYERSQAARNACIAHHGVTCVVCGFNAEETYGAFGRGFIHVHHLIPIEAIGAEYQVDPIKDLVPVCPNCHAMIHRSKPPLEIDQLKNHLEEMRLASAR